MIAPARPCKAAGCLAPGLFVALLPKCPACLAAWLAVTTGIGISAAAAAHVRTAVIVLCAAGLIASLARASRLRRLVAILQKNYKIHL
jgi:hypothetical protein